MQVSSLDELSGGRLRTFKLRCPLTQLPVTGWAGPWSGHLLLSLAGFLRLAQAETKIQPLLCGTFQNIQGVSLAGKH